jgi:hypothetical protein
MKEERKTNGASLTLPASFIAPPFLSFFLFK